MGVLYHFIEVGFLAREAAGADEFDESVVVDEDVGGVDVADLEAVLLELGAAADETVEQVPQLGLEEEARQFAAVVDLGLEDVGVVVVGELRVRRGTRTSPVEPQSPVDS
jgi:hypothetical protein